MEPQHTGGKTELNLQPKLNLVDYLLTTKAPNIGLGIKVRHRVSRLNNKVVWHVKNKENLNSQGKRKATNANPKMTQMLDYQKKILKQLQEVSVNTLEIES